MAGGEGAQRRSLDSWMVRNRLELEEELARRFENAYALAGEAGSIVGRVSRYWEVVSGPGSRVRIEVDPETYFRGYLAPYQRVGDYLVAVDPKTRRLVLLRTTRIYRSDLLAAVGVEPPISTYKPGSIESVEPLGAATLTLVEAEPLLEADPDLREPPTPAVTSLEPQSPVADPKPEVLARLLSLPGEGVLLGALSGPGGLVKRGLVPVRLPFKALLQHVLIVGTTGSGKTTLIKNMIASIYTGWSPRRPLVLVLDLNEDYVQVPFNPMREGLASLRSDPVYQGIYKSVEPPHGELILLPASRDLLAGLAERGEWSGGIGGLLSLLADSYYGRVLAPLLGDAGGRVEWIPRRLGGGRGYLLEARIPGSSVELVLSPYSIDSMSLSGDKFLSLLPGMSQLARDLIRRLRGRFRKEYGVYPPLPVLAAGMLLYLVDRLYSRGDGGESVGDEASKELLVSSIVARGLGGAENAVLNSNLYYAGEPLGPPAELAERISYYLSRLMPHDRTLEAAYRRVQAAVEAGLMDVMVYDEESDSVEVLGEPPIGRIVLEAVERRLPVIVDLKPASESGAGSIEGPRLAGLRILQGLSGWKQELYARRERGPMVLVVVDEAHQFFPQERGPREEQEANRQIAAMISRVARLGRARGIGLVFATHSPRDLHDIILQLANTKIILRTERSQLEKLQVDQEIAQYIPRFQDRLMLVQSHVYRQHGILVQTSPPVTMHYDVSAQL